MALSVCVVVVTMDRKDDLVRLLGSLSLQTRTPETVIIVDSSDVPVPSAAVADALKGKGAVEVLHRKCSLPEGRNIGLDASSCDLVSYLDDDTVLDSKYYDEVCGLFEHDADGRVAGVEGEYSNLMDTMPGRYRLIHAVNAMLFLSFPGKGGYRLSGTERPLLRSSGPARVEVLSGANMTFRREVLQRFRFDEGLKGGRFREDTDISRRVSREFQLYHLPSARLQHLLVQKARVSSSAAAVADLRNHRRIHKKNFDQSFRSRMAFRISVFGMFVHLFVDRQVDAVKPFLKAVFEKEPRPSSAQ
jgi:GT2 family glycosyltransferase